MTDKVRKTVSFPEELETQIARRAQRFDRSFSAQVVADMRTVIEQAVHRDKYFPIIGKDYQIRADSQTETGGGRESNEK